MAVNLTSIGLLVKSISLLAAGFALLLVLVIGFYYLLGRIVRSRAFFGKSEPAPRAAENGKGFAFVYRADSKAVFPPHSGLKILGVQIPRGTLNIELTTRYVDGWGQVEIPIEARIEGVSATGECATELLSEVLAKLTAVLCLGGNAWAGMPTLDSDPHHQESARELDYQAVGTLFEHIEAHPDAECLWSIVYRYREALWNWGRDRDAVALTHLHEGMRGLSELLALSGNQSPESIIRTQLYREDDVCLETAEQAWQAFAALDRFSSTAVAEPNAAWVGNAHVDAARYLRASIIRIADISEDYRCRLLDPPFDIPLSFDSRLLLSERPIADAVALRERADRLGFGLEI